MLLPYASEEVSGAVCRACQALLRQNEEGEDVKLRLRILFVGNDGFPRTLDEVEEEELPNHVKYLWILVVEGSNEISANINRWTPRMTHCLVHIILSKSSHCHGSHSMFIPGFRAYL